MALNKKSESPLAFRDIVDRQGGSFFLKNDMAYTLYGSDYISTARSLRTDKGLLFKVSIYNYFEDKEEVELGLLINPSDITIGQSTVVSNSLTRKSWISSIWGSQQQTIVCSGVSAAFFIGAKAGNLGTIFQSGLTTQDRKETLGYINFLSLVGMYKNNGNYFLQGDMNASIFSNRGRVINVMDSILLSYDGSEYVGSFNSFTLDEDPSRPFNLRYNFEFVVSCMRGDSMDGHLRMLDNDKWNGIDPQIPTAIQGRNMKRSKVIGMSTKDLNDVFKISSKDYDDEYRRFEKNKAKTANGGTEYPIGYYKGTSTGNSVKWEEEGNNLGIGIVTKVGAQDGTGTERLVPKTKDNGEKYYVGFYQVSPDNMNIGDLTGNQIIANVEKSKPGIFDTSKVPTVLKLYGQTCNAAGQTYAEFIKGAAGALKFNLDPVVLSTILNVEPAHFLTTENGRAVARTDAQGDGGRSLGITQIIDTTYADMRSKSTYQSYMKKLGFGDASTLSHDRCRTDPTYAIASSIFLLREESRSSKVGNDPVKQIIAYNGGGGKLYEKELPEATIKYVKTYRDIATNESYITQIDALL